MDNYNPEIIYNPIIWDGTAGAVSGSTDFGYFDSDTQFQQDAVKFAKWAAKRLGYPMVDVEMDSGSAYNAFEEAIVEYSSHVHEFTIRENMINLIGTPNDSTDPRYINYTKVPSPVSFQRILTISDQYGMEADVGGNVTWKKYAIKLTAGEQDYDLDAIIANDVSGSNGNAIEIRRIYHYEPIAFGQGIGAMSAGLPMNSQSILGEFGWEGLMYGGAAIGLSYTVLPVYEDLLRMQAIEFNQQIRRSAYGFEIRNNKLRIQPVPQVDHLLWVEYILKDDKLSGTQNFLTGSGYYGSGSHSRSVTTNLADAPYKNMEYSTINDPGKRWIMKYGLAILKSVVGEARSKYSSIPIPNGEVSLNGDSLKQESQTEKEQLIDQLRQSLERTATQTQWQIQSENSENQQRLLSRIPMGIYVG